ncbi:hypothetical protein IF090_12405 [Acinetobacter towneri]|uniref:hypothetical protein n=1 Tax=Acinetobacter towneri TaxID=202956 RepID=UPI001CE0B676|nr:hypothetical protein [Acinetobacter towneri]MCA4780417.1 hypothetical protein [Acinetobacter towneri]MCA4784932.1 hypothetical protein [Acinetobacter towneri]MCA4788060.1 hypothetical protein [Acinetobacter towneri]MCA4796034.1 hypothetical protein [Acinetobacter towneri]MCA4801991.1 hypothetical protein [Acinetobacter towneri]
MNDSIIPYVPIADRVRAKTHRNQLLCQRLFEVVDKCVYAQFSFNHDTKKGHLSICPDQINDLLREVAKSEKCEYNLDLDVLKKSLPDLIYPKFNGEHTITSPIWNHKKIRVWQFQLNQIAQGENMQLQDNELLLDQALASLRVWRQSLEAITGDKDVTYNNTDLVYKLMDIEQKLEKVQQSFD